MNILVGYLCKFSTWMKMYTVCLTVNNVFSLGPCHGNVHGVWSTHDTVPGGSELKDTRNNCEAVSKVCTAPLAEPHLAIGSQLMLFFFAKTAGCISLLITSLLCYCI